MIGNWKPVSFKQAKSLVRLRVLLGLLIGLRWRDLESAIRFMNVRYPQHSRVVRLLKFMRWSLDVMWSQIPDSDPWVELSETISSTPYWLTADNPIADHPWATNPVAALPERAEVVVVGAGFGGAAVAYHWSKQGATPLVILERDQAASRSAGRNGGIVVMAGGALHGYYVYGPVNKYLGLIQPQLLDAEREERAGCFADAYVKALQASPESIKEAMESEGIECGYARRGWFFYTDPLASEGLASSLALGSRRGYSDWVRRTPEQLLDRSGVRTSWTGPSLSRARPGIRPNGSGESWERHCAALKLSFSLGPASSGSSGKARSTPSIPIVASSDHGMW